MAVALVLVLQQPQDPAPADGRADVRGCRERIEGRFVRPDPEHDTVIGPIAFLDLPAAYRELRSRPDKDLEPLPGVGLPGTKVIAVVKAGARVRLVVPREQRPWLRTLYAKPTGDGEHAITIQACRRHRSRRAARRECGWGGRPPWDPRTWACRLPYTQFSGGFAVDVRNAPRRGACAELIVREKGHRAVRARLFGSRGC